MEQLSRTSLFSELSDLSVNRADDDDQGKDLEAAMPNMVSAGVSGRNLSGHAMRA